MAFMLRSPAFQENGEIPSRYTCEGANVSPPLKWSGAPPETRSFVLVMEDIDAPSGVFRHWGVYGIAPDRDLLPEGVGHGVKTESLGHGLNDFGHLRYDGPCPSEESGPHRYCFRLIALNIDSPVPVPKEPVADLWERAQPYMIAEAVLTGTYVSRRHARAEAEAERNARNVD